MAETFRTEAELVAELVRCLEEGGADRLTPECPTVIREFSYARGRTDLILVSQSGEIIAVEAKLTRWRTALIQAYRNTSFAHRSFVVVPWNVAQSAARHEFEFQRRNVGLCALKDGIVVSLREAERVEPIEPWLTAKARQMSANHNEGARA